MVTRTIRVFIADENAIFVEGIAELIRNEEDIKVVGMTNDYSQVMRVIKELHKNPDILIP